MQKCSEEGCAKAVIARGLCNTHYQKLRNNVGFGSKCKKCEKPVFARGLCRSHYNKLIRMRDLKTLCKYCDKLATENGRCEEHSKTKPGICIKCERKSQARGLCARHYNEFLRKIGLGKQCKECEKPAVSNGLCYNHYLIRSGLSCRSVAKKVATEK